MTLIMIGNLADAWANLKGVPNIVGILVGGVTALIAATVALTGAVIAALVSLHNTRKTLHQSRESLDIQRASSARPAATFIAEKRQKWVDDLRTDVSQYVALTSEMTEGWKRTFSRLSDDWGNQPPETQSELNQFTRETLGFAASIAERDSQHYQLLTRILLRLNNDEVAHVGLVDRLFKIRSLLADLNMNATVRHIYANQDIYQGIEHELQFAQVYTKAILKEEWQKLKREVANPERLIRDILATSPPDDDAVEAFVQRTAPSVPSPLSSVPPELSNVIRVVKDAPATSHR